MPVPQKSCPAPLQKGKAVGESSPRHSALVVEDGGGGGRVPPGTSKMALKMLLHQGHQQSTLVTACTMEYRPKNSFPKMICRMVYKNSMSTEKYFLEKVSAEKQLKY